MNIINTDITHHYQEIKLLVKREVCRRSFQTGQSLFLNLKGRGGNMDWEKLKAFYAVTHYGTIAAAQNHLNRSGSAISRQIQSLEQDLKTPLFIRHKKGLTLTEAGRILFGETESLFKRVSSIEKIIREKSIEPQGQLKIALTNGLVSSLLLDFLPNFLERFPQINLTINAVHHTPKLQIGEADAAILLASECHADMVQEHLMSLHLGLYAHPDYLANFGQPQTLEDLEEHRLLTFGGELGNSSFDWLLSLGLEGQSKSFIRINSLFLLQAAAEKGAGVVALPKEMISRDSELVRVLPEVEGPTLDLNLVHTEEMKHSQTLQAFKRYLKEAVNKRTTFKPHESVNSSMLEAQAF